ncbi:hypothetical protein BU16DRAFT_532482 [Lophium mytilinum]|uniref:RING-type domain-containing protein n=1 Tax=Lophium mytilinum TaxID=390894 RepID=A0A6A6RBY8_9PEZI|nr:hypothetical protein BU16DRAFT_532482 [Lophium mytilinum]
MADPNSDICPICRDPFAVTATDRNLVAAEIASNEYVVDKLNVDFDVLAKPACGHELGLFCVLRWMNQEQRQCPYCTVQMFDGTDPETALIQSVRQTREGIDEVDDDLMLAVVGMLDTHRDERVMHEARLERRRMQVREQMEQEVQELVAEFWTDFQQGRERLWPGEVGFEADQRRQHGLVLERIRRNGLGLAANELDEIEDEDIRVVDEGFAGDGEPILDLEELIRGQGDGLGGEEELIQDMQELIRGQGERFGGEEELIRDMEEIVRGQEEFLRGQEELIQEDELIEDVEEVFRKVDEVIREGEEKVVKVLLYYLLLLAFVGLSTAGLVAAIYGCEGGLVGVACGLVVLCLIKVLASMWNSLRADLDQLMLN